MRILVTGGAGFIGANFVHLTLDTRPDTFVTVLDTMGYAANRQSLEDIDPAHASRFQLVEGSVCDAELVDKLVAEHDVVVHFAAESHNDNSLRTPMIFAETNVLGTVTLLEAIRRHNKRLHHISTDEVFGDLDFDSTESFTPTTRYQPSSPYSASKAAADHFVRAYIRSFGIKATISNCSNNYGPRQDPEKFIPRQITGLLAGEKPRLYGSGANIRDWIHVDDHNRAVWAILDKGELGRTYLIGARGEHTNREVVEMLLTIFGRPVDDFVHVTDRAGHDRRYAIDPTSIEELGWKPQYQDFREGLQETVDWYRSHPQWWQAARDRAETRYREQEKVIAPPAADK